MRQAEFVRSLFYSVNENNPLELCKVGTDNSFQKQFFLNLQWVRIFDCVKK